jgi:Sensors of blue-light using FAD
MRSIVYFSTAVRPLSAEELTALGQECADHDTHVGITGMLLHKNGDFLQVLEGSNAVIRDMYARIEADPRHTDIRKIDDRTIPSREFAGRAVRYQDLDKLPAGSPFLNPFSYETFQADPALAMLMLAYFFRNL